jgi:hypothetical protein
VKAYLYTWGEGRVTAEGERIQGEAEGYADGGPVRLVTSHGKPRLRLVCDWQHCPNVADAAACLLPC